MAKPIADLLKPIAIKRTHAENEAMASKKLRLALKEGGLKMTRRLERICEEFPKTKTATEARAFLSIANRTIEKRIAEAYETETRETAQKRIDAMKMELAKAADEVDKEP